ncbi:MAG: PAS domain-containing protein [Rhodobacteraceae bacterium]|nr:PAS domain-containing protein [Paracoccaceae bacterium]
MIQRLNDNFLTLAGGRDGGLMGERLVDHIALDGGDEGASLHDRVMQGETVQGRFRVRRRDEEDAIIEGGLYPIVDRRGSTAGTTLIGSDVTAAQRQLREAESRQQAMQAAQQSVVEALRIGMRDISTGDLTSRLTTPFAPEYEQLRTDFNDALENLTRAMANIAQQTSEMHSETAEIVKAADEMSVRTERQAMTLQDTASSLDELTTNIGQTADGAARANEVVTEARARAEESGSIVDEAESAMAEISASSKEIMKVISVIDDISFQTNLLALNAGVEAARAGEAGRGFAVVATEVRALAQRCANAAAEINQLITVSGQHVSRGVELVGVTGETLKKIVSSISEISDYIAEIAQAGKEQSIGLNQVNSAVNQIDHVTQQNAAMFEETTSASHALAQRANSLAETIGHFRVGDLPVAPAARPRGKASGKEDAARGTAPATRGNLAVAPAKAPETSGWEDF